MSLYEFLRASLALIGLFVVVLWLLGSLGLGDFVLYFGPEGTGNATHQSESDL